MFDVRLQRIEKSFGATAVLRGIDLEVGAGELVVMLGPSGCGKTTLLRIVAGLESVDAGSIHIGGRDVTRLPPRELGLGMVFQSDELYPHLSVRENLAFPLKVQRLAAGEIDARIAEIASMMELKELLERKPKDLSGGQRQRVAIGRALVRRPGLCLLDEPLSNLDATLRVHTRGEISRLHARLGMTMLYVTHDQVEAMTLATRVALFGNGRLQQFGAPLELYRKPRNRFVAGFLGSPSMNFFKATADASAFRGAGFTLPAAPGIEAGDVLLGIRPQALSIAPDGVFAGTVDAIERLGTDGFAYLSTASGPLTARFDARVSLKVGDAVRVAVAPHSVHVFSADGETARHHPELTPG